jgi:glutamate--cysteine ligase catalytic subunit
MAMDDRTDEEKDKNSSKYIYKSRYSPVYSYISSHEYIQDFHNDYPKMPIDKKIHQTLLENDFSERLATHFSNLLVRDPLVIYDEKINLQEKDVAHFENYNSTNWNSLRFKPPRSQDNDNCFKIEIRPCELQLTPFENASILTFCLIYSQLVTKKDVNFIIPITKVDRNFEKAHESNAFENQLFSFRIDGLKNYKKESKLYDNNYLSHGNALNKDYFNEVLDAENIKEMTLRQIFCGSEEHQYEGLLNVMHDFVEEKILNPQVKEITKLHLNFIENRVKGKLFYFIF